MACERENLTVPPPCWRGTLRTRRAAARHTAQPMCMGTAAAHARTRSPPQCEATNKHTPSAANAARRTHTECPGCSKQTGLAHMPRGQHRHTTTATATSTGPSHARQTSTLWQQLPTPLRLAFCCFAHRNEGNAHALQATSAVNVHNHTRDSSKAQCCAKKWPRAPVVLHARDAGTSHPHLQVLRHAWDAPSARQRTH
jgi:hypothetical protein